MKSLLRTLLPPVLRRRPLARTADPMRALRTALDLGDAWKAAMAPADAAPSTSAPPSPASTAAGGSSFDEATHVHAGLSRRYRLFVPTRPAAAPALVMMLHGCTQDAEDFARGTRMNAWAERDGFLVVYPIQGRTANPAGCWNWFREPDQLRGHGEVAFLADLASTVARDHHVDPGAIFVAGLSAGAAMAALLAREYPDVFAAVGLHSGLAAGAARNLPDAMTAMQKGRAGRAAAGPSDHAAVAAIVIHGDRDTTVHPDNADHLAASLRPADDGGAAPADEADPSAGRSARRRVYRQSDGRVRVEQWTLHGAGHAWSGGDARGTYTAPSDFDATAQMVRFFLAHRRSPSAS